MKRLFWRILHFFSIPRLVGWRGRPKAILVAGYDSSAEAKEIADYICDGIDDQVEIQFAIDHCPEGTTVKLDGSFNLITEDSRYNKGR